MDCCASTIVASVWRYSLRYSSCDIDLRYRSTWGGGSGGREVEATHVARGWAEQSYQKCPGGAHQAISPDALDLSTQGCSVAADTHHRRVVPACSENLPGDKGCAHPHAPQAYACTHSRMPNALVNPSRVTGRQPASSKVPETLLQEPLEQLVGRGVGRGADEDTGFRSTGRGLGSTRADRRKA